MRKPHTMTFAAILLAAGSVAGMPAVAADGEAAIKERVAFMKNDILKPYLAIKNFVKEGKGTAQEVAANARKLHTVADRIPGLFPKGTGRGAYDEKTTRALPKIWEDWAGFQAASASLAAASAQLAQVADGGDAAAIGAQFGELGKKGCGGCHKPFRGAKVK